MTTSTSEAERYVAQEEAQLIGRNYLYVRDYRSAAVARRAFLAGWAAHAERVRGLVEAADEIKIHNDADGSVWLQLGAARINVDRFGPIVRKNILDALGRFEAALAAYDREGK